MRAWVVPWALVLISCISDLRPEVGELVQAGLDAGQGSITGDNGSNSGAGASNGGSSDGTGGNGNGDGGSGGTDSKDGGADPEGDAGCDPSKPNPGPVSGCDRKDSDPCKTVSFKNDIWPILSGCRCHDPEDGDQFGILEVGFVIDDYATLRQGGDNTGANVIVAGNACDSLILQKLREDQPFVGVRMPRDGPYLPEETIRLIEDWIVEGARDN